MNHLNPPSVDELNKELLKACAGYELKDPVMAIQRLLNLGADANCQIAPTFHSPLHNVAFYTGNPVVASLLMQHGADVQAKTGRQRSPLHYACGQNHCELARLLLDQPHGAKVDAVDDVGSIPLQYACCYNENGSCTMVRLLLEHGAAVDSTDIEHGYSGKAGTLLMAACRKPSDDLVELLLQHGANVNVSLNNGATPLHWTRRARTAQLLLECGANLEAKTVDGNTPLHTATAMKSLDGELISFLLKQGADSTVENRKYLTPRDLAKQNDFSHEFMMHDIGRYNAYKDLVSDSTTYFGELMATIPEAELIEEIGAYVGVPVRDELRELRVLTSLPRQH